MPNSAARLAAAGQLAAANVHDFPPQRRATAEEYLRKELQALHAHTAVLDETGCIVLVNRAWSAFAARGGAAGDLTTSVGANYLEICRRAAGTDPEAQQALLGISAVLDGSLRHFEMEYSCPDADQEHWYLMSVAPLDPGSVGGVVISHQDITSSRRADEARHTSEERFRAMFANAAVGIAELAPDGQLLHVNDKFASIAGYDPDALRSRTLFDITHPSDIDADTAHFEVMRTGGRDSYTIEKRLLRPDDVAVPVAATISCVRAANGDVERFVAVIDDISDRMAAAERQHTLMLELAHRGKNLLAVVQSIASRSLAEDRPLADARVAFIGRLQALSQTYDIFGDDPFGGAPLDALLQTELAAFGTRAHLDGPSVILTVKAAQTFAMVAHELATNAAKYGAFSVPDGQLHIAWDIIGTGDQRRFQFDWRESGGPPARAPARRGFGTTLVSQVAGSEFACGPMLDYTAEGFRYRFDAPLARLGDALADSPVRRKLRNAVVCSLYDTWARRRGAKGNPQYSRSLTGPDSRPPVR